MGLIGQVMSLIFGDGRNAVAETVEVFRANAERTAQRDAEHASETLKQFAAEFAHQRKGIFDRFVDGVNRLPRPMLALGTIALFVSAMFNPVWFSSRMTGIALVPEPLWWLMGAIVSFYFGARHQTKGQDFQRSIAATVAMGQAISTAPPRMAAVSVPFADNAALAEWEATRDRLGK